METKLETISKLKQRGRLYNKYKYAYLLILPAIIFVFIFSYLPLLGIVIVFKDYDVMTGVMGSPWVGFENFRILFKSPEIFKAIKNTLVYGCVILFGAFPFPIILALMFNEVKNATFKKATQTISYMMYFLSWISVVGMMYSLFALEGPLNQFLTSVIDGYEAKNFLLESEYFLPILFFTHLWKNCGWSSVIFLAAIAGIDPGLYEAATVDGCNKWKQAWHITIPSILPTIIIVFIMSLGSIVSVNFEQVFGFQNVYTQEETEIIGTLIYRMGILNGEYSISAAFGLAQGLVSLIMLLVSNTITKKLADISII